MYAIQLHTVYMAWYDLLLGGPPCICCLQFHVTTYMDNTLPGMNPSTQRSGRPIKSISQVCHVGQAGAVTVLWSKLPYSTDGLMDAFDTPGC